MSWRVRLHAAWYGFRARLRSILRGQREDRDFDEELAFHLEQEAAKYRRAGMDDAEARAAAVRALGAPERIRSEERASRGVGFVDELVQDVGYGIRALRSWPLSAAVIVLTLAAGIGAVTTIFAAADALVLERLPFHDLDRLVVVGAAGPDGSFPGGEAWLRTDESRRLRALPVFERSARLRYLMVVMTGTGAPVEVIGGRASPGLFSLLGVEAMIGSAALPAAAAGEEHAVVLAERFWRRHFGADPEVIGRSVRLGDRIGTITGVLPPGVEYPLGMDVWVPLPTAVPLEDSSGERVVAKLAPGATAARANAALRTAWRNRPASLQKARPDGGYRVEGLLDNVTSGTRPMLTALGGAAAFLLLIVCANVASLLMSAGERRRSEIALRLALGAHRGRIVRQLMTESLLLAGLGAVGGLVAAAAGAHYLREGLSIDRLRFYIGSSDRIGIDATVLGFAIAVAALTAVVFGTLPALRTSRVRLATAMQGLAAGSGRPRSRLRSALVVAEVGLALTLTLGAAAMVRGVAGVAAADLGYDRDTLTIAVRGWSGSSVQMDSGGFVREALERLAGLGAVRSAAVASGLPGDPHPRARLQIESSGDPESTGVATVSVTPGFFGTLDVPLLSGRGLSAEDDGAGAPVAVVSRSLARAAWPNGDPIGERVRTDDEEPWRTVVGVAGDVARSGNDARPSPALYLPWAQAPARGGLFMIDSATGIAALPEVRAILQEVAPDLPLAGPPTLAAASDEQLAPLRLVTALLAGFALLGCLLALSGVYALVARSVTARTPEVGVRLAMGARPADIRRQFAIQGLKIAALGVGAGLLVAWGLGRVLARVLARFPPVSGSSTAVVVATAVLFLLVTLAAGYLPARRGAETDPSIALRESG